MLSPISWMWKLRFRDISDLAKVTRLVPLPRPIPVLFLRGALILQPLVLLGLRALGVWIRQGEGAGWWGPCHQSKSLRFDPT